VSGKDQSVVSKEALMSTKPGKQIIKQGLFKSKGFKLFKKYKEETEQEFPNFAERFAKDMMNEIKSDSSPNSTQQAFAEEVGSTEIILQASEIDPIKSKLEDFDVLKDRVFRILNSNFVKMTFPVFNALFDAAAEFSGKNAELKQDIVEGHILAIDLSEPMDRIVDKDEDLEYLDDYKLMNPYILKLARDKISKGGELVLKEFEDGFKDARIGQYLDEKLKSKPTQITEEEMVLSYKKYRAVMALYYSLLANDVKKGFELTLEKSNLYLKDARLALELLPDGFSHKEFLEFLFLTVEHYNHFWYNKLEKANMWNKFTEKLPSD
jgi:hypothetical protein